MTSKKLYRSRENAMIGGVCAGLAEYFNIDSSLVRLATVILVFPGGLSLWAYIIAWIIVPQKPLIQAEIGNGADESVQKTSGTILDEPAGEGQDKSRMVIGIVLVALGIVFLLNAFDIFTWFSFMKLWPIALIIVGLAVLFKALNKGSGDAN
jgi:phage shock protein C